MDRRLEPLAVGRADLRPIPPPELHAIGVPDAIAKHWSAHADADAFALSAAESRTNASAEQTADGHAHTACDEHADGHA